MFTNLLSDSFDRVIGEYGDTFWVTLKGTVGIKVKTEREIEKNGERVKEKIDLEVASRGAGYAFGHLALLERKPRAATIYCKEDCEFAVLNKAPFQRILCKSYSITRRKY